MNEDITTGDMATFDGIQKAKSKKVIKTPVAGYSYLEEGQMPSEDNIAKFKARPDYENIMKGFASLCKEYGLKFGDPRSSIKAQLSKRNPLIVKEFISLMNDFCKKYDLTLQNLGLVESYDFPGEEVNYTNKMDYDKLRQDIITTYDHIVSAGIEPEIAIGQVAVKFRQDPGYVKALVESSITESNKEVMTEKENKAKRLLESYGVITKAPISEKEEESEDEESEEKEEKEPKEKKGPKKGVNPFEKKGSKEDEESEEESEEEEAIEEEVHEFKAAGSTVEVKGIEREVAKVLAAKLLAPLKGTAVPPIGKYVITFEVIENEEEEA